MTTDYKATGLIDGRYQVRKADGRPVPPEAKAKFEAFEVSLT